MRCAWQTITTFSYLSLWFSHDGCLVGPTPSARWRFRRNRPVAATGRGRRREHVVAAVAHAVVVIGDADSDEAVVHPLMPIRSVGVLGAVAHPHAAAEGRSAGTPVSARAEI